MYNFELIQQRIDDARGSMQEAAKNSDNEAFAKAQQDMMQALMEKALAEHEDVGQQAADVQVLAQRGVRQLTSQERSYYQKVADAMRASNPKQALTDLDAVLPVTVIDAVFEDLKHNHPLLSRIDFQNTSGLIEMIMNTDTTELAVWGPLCGDITKELSSGFKKVNNTLYKLSAFLPVCKAMLDLGPAWLDRYVREILAEALACGLENGIVNGDGKDAPIGMVRQVGDGVSVVGGQYPKKAAIKLSTIDPATIGNLLSIMAMGPNGKTRLVRNVVFLVNGQDYYQKVMPATTLLAPDGTYRNDVMPYPMTVIPTFALARGEAIIGLSDKYFAPVGMSREGRIEYSDEYHFLDDERVYLIKLYANGMPKDNNAFLLLDISDLQPATYKVTQVEAPNPSSDATLASLSLGSAALSPTFSSATTTYTATTTNATNVINAVPAAAGSEVAITVGDVPVDNGSAITWNSGSNVVKVVVTADDGTSKTYQITVTKS